MARYIDAEKAIGRLQAKCINCVNYDVCTSCYVDKIIDEFRKAPTSDVAPRAEVAREIFEEINAIKKEYASGDIDSNKLYIRLFQLEKKYTEGER